MMTSKISLKRLGRIKPLTDWIESFDKVCGDALSERFDIFLVGSALYRDDFWDLDLLCIPKECGSDVDLGELFTWARDILSSTNSAHVTIDTRRAPVEFGTRSDKRFHLFFEPDFTLPFASPGCTYVWTHANEPLTRTSFNFSQPVSKPNWASEIRRYRNVITNMEMVALHFVGGRECYKPRKISFDEEHSQKLYKLGVGLCLIAFWCIQNPEQRLFDRSQFPIDYDYGIGERSQELVKQFLMPQKCLSREGTIELLDRMLSQILALEGS